MIYETFYDTNQVQVDKIWPNPAPESMRRVTYVVGHDSRSIILRLGADLGKPSFQKKNYGIFHNWSDPSPHLAKIMSNLEKYSLF